MDIYAEITNRIMSQMEGGVIPWRKPWISFGSCISYATGKPYSLLNQMLLGRPGEYLTFNECRKAGGYVRKGEKASMVVFWTWLEREDEETGEVKNIPFLRYYNVFHIDQCEGLKARHAEPLPQTVNPDEQAEAIIANYLRTSGVKLHHEQGDRAFYRPVSDSITLPLLAQFRETAEYYSTAFHEMVHSTGHKSRLDRLEKTAFFGSEAYSKEELVAEIGASALVNHAGLETASSFRNNAAYSEAASYTTISQLDTYIFPLAFLYRHSLELVLKAIAFQNITSKEDQIEFLKSTRHIHIQIAWNHISKNVANLTLSM